MLARLYVASMWPRSRERGNSLPSQRHLKRASASMWPRSRERGNATTSHVASVSRLLALQCGRAHVSAETLSMLDADVTRSIASMWPRSRERGNPIAQHPRATPVDSGFNVAALT